ncbi:MAG: HAD-IC family P-type ATPase, partial [Oscillospiraceae bacterium]
MDITDINTGLTAQQAEQKKAAGESNGSFEVKTKSVREIIFGNVFTLFNLINVVLALMIAFVGSWRNLLFMGVVISNTAIGIIQELRSKRTIDRLSLISAPKARLLRDCAEQALPVSEIVLGDIMLLGAGQQVCADAVVVQGSCEADESLVTGEAEPVCKQPGDELLSGSFIVSGSVKAQALRVGAESFSNRMTSGVKYIKKQNSEMMKSINKIISIISVCIFPFGAVLLWKALNVTKQTLASGVVSTAAALIGMIPEGLVLLTSIALALSAIRLAKKRTLCQDLCCVESLARVDVLCLDKTGTLTEGSMQLDKVVPLDEQFDVSAALNALTASLTDPNSTLKAVCEKYSGGTSWKLTRSVAFSSARKWSGASFEGKGSFVLGAPDFVLNREILSEISHTAAQYTARGLRVLVLGHSEGDFSGEALPEGISPKALLILSDKVRENAPKTLEYFREQGVAIKVISGDDPVTVAQLAERAGVQGADSFVDASKLNDSELQAAAESTVVFGRVTPYQKQLLVKALKSRGHNVAMTGDGVNDVLALKEADCSIAMQSGSDAARCVSQLVLLDSDFACLPMVVSEGRRTINNIQRSAALFLVKTIFSFLLAVIFLFLPLPYP